MLLFNKRETGMTKEKTTQNEYFKSICSSVPNILQGKSHVANISEGKSEAWEHATASGRKVISYEDADYSLLARYFAQLLEKVNENSTKRFSVSELDSLLWYGYRSDPVRQEMARALAKII